MKTIITILIILALFGCKEDSGELKPCSRTHLFILSGQSNMVGLPEDVFKETAATSLLCDKVIVVKNAKSGRPIIDWYPNGYLYDALMVDVWASLDQTPDTITVIWMQGEADAAYLTAYNYASNVEGLINQSRTDLNHQDINVVIGRISDYKDIGYFPYWDTIRSQQELIALEEGYSLINTDDLNGVNNGLHYTDEGYKILSQRFAGEAIRLIKINP